MTEIICGYPGDRDQAILSYLYGDSADLDRAERATFEAHVAGCERCRSELAALEGVRTTLAGWTPPALRPQDRLSFGPVNAPPEPPQSTAWWRDVPVWARAAAALLCLAAGVSIANLDVQYGSDGFRVRTGWTAEPAAVAQRVGQETQGSPAAAAPWRAELTAFEERLRSELAPAESEAARPASIDESELFGRVRTLVRESEQRQQRELALRLAETMREISALRQADLMRIERNIGAMQSSTGREMLRQRSEMLNYLTVRTASQRPR
jgi:hypothetical protein